MLYRNKKEKDINKGKYVGIGGHVEKNESPNEAVIREVKEETWLNLLSFKERGIVYFVLNDYQEEMFLYTSNNFDGELIECNESDLLWVEKEKLLSLNMWEGDKYFLNYLLNDLGYFKMRLIYQDDVLVKYELIEG